MSVLRVIRHDLREVSTIQHVMKNMLETSKGIIKTNVKGFTEEYNLDLPFKSMTDFQVFDTRLGSDAKFRQDFMSSLYFLLDRENVLTKSVTNILRKFMSRDIALKFTAVKQSLGKLILKETFFAECLKDFFEYQNYDEPNPGNRVTEKALYNALGAALTNSKDWDGFRSIRSNQRKQ